MTVAADLTWTHYRSGGFMARSLAGLYNEIVAELSASGFQLRPGQQL